MIKAIIGSIIGNIILCVAIGIFIYKKYGERISKNLDKLTEIERLLNKFL